MKEEILSHPKKTLKRHLKNVGKISQTIVEKTSINLPIHKDILKKISYLIGLYHDVGKATTFFQKYLKEENETEKAKLKNRIETKHSLISAISTYCAIEEFFNERKYNNEYKDFLLTSSFIIVRRHHTDLSSILEDLKFGQEEKNSLQKQFDSLPIDYLSFLPYWDAVRTKLPEYIKNWPLKKLKISKYINQLKNEVLLYLIHHFLFSVLLDADKHETVIGYLPKRKNISSDIVEQYRIQKGFNVFNNQIDKIRNEIYNIVNDQVHCLDLDKEYILSLTAPTGSGKTLTSLGFAIKLRDRIMKEKGYIPRIIYSLPFLSIIDQNAKVIESVFEETGHIISNDLFLIHHHLSDYIYKTNGKEEYEPEASEILIEGWDSEIIITTFVQLFHTIFSNKNKAVRKFNKLAGSIIILDEIQSFPSKYWQLFKEIANKFAEYFNTYFLLSTATQPAIFDNSKELLIKKEEFFKKFNRTKIYIKTKPILTIQKFCDYFVNELKKNQKSVLVVLNTIKTAKEIYKKIKEPLQKLDYELYFLSSHVVPFQRLERIQKIKNNKRNKIVISTQLIEAGVDIDMKKVIRDLGPIDSINQVAGRANRNWLIEKGEVEIITLKDEQSNKEFYSYIYDPVFIDATQKVLENIDDISEKEFLGLIDKYYKELKSRISFDKSHEYFEAIKMLNYEKIKEFELIDKKMEKIDIFVELNCEASKVWNEYQEIKKTNDIRKRKNQFLQIRNKFYNFVISPYIYQVKDNPPFLIEGIGYISHSQLNEFYDIETGFDPENKISIW